MNFKGMHQLRKYVPDLNSTRGRLRIALYALGLFLLVTYYFILTDAIPTWSIDSQILILALGFLLLSLFFSLKRTYQDKYKGLAYRNAFAHFAIPGLALIFAAIAHAGYMNGPLVPRGWWTLVIMLLGAVMLIVGAILWIRSILTFGADNLALFYVYHPEAGRIVDSSIYSILRHPIYAGALRVGIGLALLNGNGNALVFALLLPLAFAGWVVLVEERELVRRFGQSYRDYRKRVPAFWPRWRELDRFFNFLIKGETA